MKLRLIAEIQRKWPTTNMDRTNCSSVYAASSMNDYYHVMHPNGAGHGQRQRRKKSNKSKEGKV